MTGHPLFNNSDIAITLVVDVVVVVVVVVGNESTGRGDVLERAFFCDLDVVGDGMHCGQG